MSKSLVFLSILLTTVSIRPMDMPSSMDGLGKTVEASSAQSGDARLVGADFLPQAPSTAPQQLRPVIYHMALHGALAAGGFYMLDKYSQWAARWVEELSQKRIQQKGEHTVILNKSLCLLRKSDFFPDITEVIGTQRTTEPLVHDIDPALKQKIEDIHNALGKAAASHQNLFSPERIVSQSNEITRSYIQQIRQSGDDGKASELIKELEERLKDLRDEEKRGKKLAYDVRGTLYYWVNDQRKNNVSVDVIGAQLSKFNERASIYTTMLEVYSRLQETGERLGIQDYKFLAVGIGSKIVELSLGVANIFVPSLITQRFLGSTPPLFDVQSLQRRIQYSSGALTVEPPVERWRITRAMLRQGLLVAPLIARGVASGALLASEATPAIAAGVGIGLTAPLESSVYSTTLIRGLGAQLGIEQIAAHTTQRVIGPLTRHVQIPTNLFILPGDIPLSL